MFFLQAIYQWPQLAYQYGATDHSPDLGPPIQAGDNVTHSRLFDPDLPMTLKQVKHVNFQTQRRSSIPHTPPPPKKKKKKKNSKTNCKHLCSWFQVSANWMPLVCFYHQHLIIFIGKCYCKWGGGGKKNTNRWETHAACFGPEQINPSSCV